MCIRDRLRYQFEKDKYGWIGRPHARKEDNQKSDEKPIILPKEQIIKQSLEDIMRWNNSEHATEKGKSRWEVQVEKQTKNSNPTNWKAILPTLGYKTTTSCNAGIIKFRNEEYLLGINGEVSTGENLITFMKYVEGKEFEVFWLDANDGSILKAMIYHNDMMICELIKKPSSYRSSHEATEETRINRQITVSYTHLDVYKRQALPSATPLPLPTMSGLAGLAEMRFPAVPSATSLPSM